MLKTCLLCSLHIWFAFEYIFFEIYFNALACISFAKFEINFWNPLNGRHSFDFVHPEPRSVRPGCNDVLWIQHWCSLPYFFLSYATTHVYYKSDIFYCRKYLRETLKIANAEDLNRLTACSLVLLGHTFLAVGNPQVINKLNVGPCKMEMEILKIRRIKWKCDLAYHSCLHHVFHSLSNHITVCMQPWSPIDWLLTSIVICELEKDFMFTPQEALDMVLPATQLAGRIPDTYIQLWAASLLRGKCNYWSMKEIFDA